MTDDSASRGPEDEESGDDSTAPGHDDAPPREPGASRTDAMATDSEPATGSGSSESEDGDGRVAEQATLGDATGDSSPDPVGPQSDESEEPASNPPTDSGLGIDDERSVGRADDAGTDGRANGDTRAGDPGAVGRGVDDPGVDDRTVEEGDDEPGSSGPDFVPEDVQKYARFQKMDGARYDRVNEFLRDRTYVTAREWAIARLCADFRTETGVEMTKIGEHLPRLVPFMTDTYTPQAVNQARHSFEEKVRKSGATFLYGAMSGFFTAEQLDDVMYEITEVAKFLLEVEGADLTVEEELEAEDRILSVMREVRKQSERLRHEGVECPECGHEIGSEHGHSDDGAGDSTEAEDVAGDESSESAPESDA